VRAASSGDGKMEKGDVRVKFKFQTCVVAAGSAALTPRDLPLSGRRIQFKFGMLDLTTFRLDETETDRSILSYN
jgi:hypothetical protein